MLDRVLLGREKLREMERKKIVKVWNGEIRGGQKNKKKRDSKHLV